MPLRFALGRVTAIDETKLQWTVDLFHRDDGDPDEAWSMWLPKYSCTIHASTIYLADPAVTAASTNSVTLTKSTLDLMGRIRGSGCGYAAGVGLHRWDDVEGLVEAQIEQLRRMSGATKVKRCAGLRAQLEALRRERFHLDTPNDSASDNDASIDGGWTTAGTV